VVAVSTCAAGLRAQSRGMFSAQAEAVGAGETSIRRGAYNVAVSLEDELPGLPTTIRVSRNGRLFERSFDFRDEFMRRC